MATAVGRALALDEPLIVEAGTGTGKTFAYLVPALLSGRSVIISTGTRTLQDQLFRRDVPMLARALGAAGENRAAQGPRELSVPPSARARHAAARRCSAGERGTARMLARVVALGGDRPRPAILPSSPICRSSRRVWPTITSTRENCLGQECPQFARCHVFEARRAAQAADIVVVNHHLLLADLALKDEGFGDLLPGAEAVILDEAHQVPDIAAQFFGQSWSVRAGASICCAIQRAEMQAAGVRAPSVERCCSRPSSSTSIAAATRRSARRAGRYEWGSLPERFWMRCRRSRPRLQRARRRARRARRGRRAPPTARGAPQRWPRSSRSSRDAPEEAGMRWVEASAGWTCAALHALRDRGAPAQYVEARPAPGYSPPRLWRSARTSRTLPRASACREARTLKIDSPFDYQQSGAHFSAARHAGAAGPAAMRSKFIEACAPLLEASGGPGVPALHQLSRAWRGRDRARGALSRIRRFPCWCRARRRAKRCSTGFASSATRCCSPRAVSGRAWT